MYALVDTGVFPTYAWREFISLRYGIWSMTWSWNRILLHAHGTEMEAIAAIPALFEAYAKDMTALGAKTIQCQCRERFPRECIPEKTTTEPWAQAGVQQTVQADAASPRFLT